MLKRPYSNDESLFAKKNKKDPISPVSVADIQSTTTSPRKVSSPVPLHMGMMGLSLQLPSELDRAEKNDIHPSFHTTWDDFPKKRKDIRKKSDALYREIDIQARKHAKAVANMEDIDKPYNKLTYGVIKPISEVYHTQYEEGDKTTFNQMKDDNLIFGGRTRRARKNRKTMKSKKSRNPMKTRKSKKSRRSAKRPTRRNKRKI